MRYLLLALHRWAGLTIAVAVVITGITGAIIPYQDQIRSLLAPDIWNVDPPAPDARPLSGLEIMRIVEEDSGGKVSFMPLLPDRDHAQSVFVSPEPGGPPLEYEQAFVDPFTGEIRARVNFADLRDGAINVAPFLVLIHYSLGAGETGRWLLGMAALLWAVVAVIGVVLTLPRRSAGDWRAAIERWKPAWRIRPGRGSRIFLYDLHRAAGLWIWPAMLVFTWSAVAFNLADVHRPVQRLLGAEGLYQPVVNPTPAPGDPMNAERALTIGEELMAREAERQGFTVYEPEAMSFRPYAQLIGYYARTSLDGPAEEGSTAVWFDQVSGEQVKFEHPYGPTRADAFDKVLRLLHTGDLFGWPLKILVSLFGLLAATMAAAGMALWIRKAGRQRQKVGALQVEQT